VGVVIYETADDKYPLAVLLFNPQLIKNHAYQRKRSSPKFVFPITNISKDLALKWIAAASTTRAASDNYQ